jgi:hypothetical protein
MDYDPSELRPMAGNTGYGSAYGDDSAPPDPSAPQTMPLSPNPVPPTTGPVPDVTALVAPTPAAATPSATSASRRAGVAVIAAGVGVGTGALLGGLWGAGSGLFFAGAACNAFRARQLFCSDTPGDQAEAIKTTVMTVVGVGLAGYLGYKAHASKKDDDA